MDLGRSVSLLLEQSASGSDSATTELLALVYDELRGLAEALVRDQRPGGTLQPTALVHEAYIRLVGQELEATTRGQFFMLASKAMRSVLIDHARARGRAKRGGDWQRVALETVDDTPLSSAGVPLIDISSALDELATLDARKAQLVELRFFGGLTSEQASEVLGISRSTVAEEWRAARAWLHHRLESYAP